MTDTQKGVLAMIGAATIWGLSPIYFKLLSHVPPIEVLAHRIIWSLVFFAGVLAVQSRLGEIRVAMAGWRRVFLITLAAVTVSANWGLFIYATQIDRNTETSLGYYIFPLVAVLLGRFVFAERLELAQLLAVALATLAVVVLTWGVGAVPWISLTLAVTFGLYGTIKKTLPVGPVVSVTCEMLTITPPSIAVLIWFHAQGQGVFGATMLDNVLLIASGPLTALPLILFTIAARSVSLATVGLLQYINPTLQFICAVMIFGEPFTRWEATSFPMIWAALAIYSVAALRHDRTERNAAIAVAGVSAHVTNSASDSSAKP